MTRVRAIGWMIAGASAMLVGTPAQAATCQARGGGVIFQPYDPLTKGITTGVGTIDIECDGSDTYTVALDLGASPEPGQGRRMVGPAGNLLSYNLFSDSSARLVWGDGSSGATSTVSGAGAKSSFTVYGRIFPEQHVVAGSYSDTVVVTISFN
jgi:spore coat protein U-like protein